MANMMIPIRSAAKLSSELDQKLRFLFDRREVKSIADEVMVKWTTITNLHDKLSVT